MVSSSSQQQRRTSLILLLVLFIGLLGINAAATLNGPSSNSVTTKFRSGALQQQSERLLSSLQPPDIEHAEFYEYQPGTYDFVLQYDEDGGVHANVELDPSIGNDIVTIFTDCDRLSSSSLNCYDDAYRLNFTLDVYIVAVPDDANEYEINDILYTRPDGKVYSIFDQSVALGGAASPLATTDATNNDNGTSDEKNNSDDSDAPTTISFEKDGHEVIVYAFWILVPLLSILSLYLMITLRKLRKATRYSKPATFDGDDRMVQIGISS